MGIFKRDDNKDTAQSQHKKSLKSSSKVLRKSISSNDKIKTKKNKKSFDKINEWAEQATPEKVKENALLREKYKANPELLTEDERNNVH